MTEPEEVTEPEETHTRVTVSAHETRREESRPSVMADGLRRCVWAEAAGTMIPEKVRPLNTILKAKVRKYEFLFILFS